jgi:hypothetical protein
VRQAEIAANKLSAEKAVAEKVAVEEEYKQVSHIYSSDRPPPPTTDITVLSVDPGGLSVAWDAAGSVCDEFWNSKTSMETHLLEEDYSSRKLVRFVCDTNVKIDVIGHERISMGPVKVLRDFFNSRSLDIKKMESLWGELKAAGCFRPWHEASSKSFRPDDTVLLENEVRCMSFGWSCMENGKKRVDGEPLKLVREETPALPLLLLLLLLLLRLFALLLLLCRTTAATTPPLYYRCHHHCSYHLTN